MKSTKQRRTIDNTVRSKSGSSYNNNLTHSSNTTNNTTRITKEDIIKDYMKLVNVRQLENPKPNQESKNLSNTYSESNQKTPVKLNFNSEEESVIYNSRINSSPSNENNFSQKEADFNQLNYLHNQNDLISLCKSLQDKIHADQQIILNLERERDEYKSTAEKYKETATRLGEDVIFLRTQLDNFLHYKK